MAYDFTARGVTFSIPDLFHEGHVATQAEADLINRAVGRAARQALQDGKITCRDDALIFSTSDDALTYTKTLQEGSERTYKMKINMQAVPRSVTSFDDVCVGNVYRTQKKLYVIISIIERAESACGNSAAAFSIDNEGNIEGVVAYNTFYFSRQKLVGFAHIPETIEVDWF